MTHRHKAPDTVNGSSERYSDAELAAALDACAREPVHAPGAIQPGGCLIAMDESLSKVLQVSTNLEAWLGIPAEQALRHAPGELFGEALLERLRQTLEGMPASAVAIRATLPPVGRTFELSCYPSGRYRVVELEPLADDDEYRLLSAINGWLTTVRETASSQALLDLLVQEVHRLTGFERVMLYRFDERWNGAVVAERRDPGLDSLLDHHFPASDIPPQVRQLYALNPLRSIPEAAARAVPLLSAETPDDDAPLDLSLGVLRAVSPIHQQYLANMGVASALSVALHDGEGRLTGLLSCHALRSPYAITPTLRSAVLALVQIAVPHLTLLQAKAESRLMQKVQVSHELLSEHHQRWVDPALILERRGAEWGALFSADGIVLSHRRQHGTWGQVPDDQALDAIIDWLNRTTEPGSLWHGHCLKETPLAPWRGPSSGLLAAPLPINTEATGWLLLFRNEETQTLRWAGEPHKSLERHHGTAMLTPRRSFAEWQETVSDRSRVWRRTERRAVRQLADNLAAVIAGHEVYLLNDRLQELNAQLEHLASRDGLTGVWNRYRIEQAIGKEVAAVARYPARDCALLLFDIDHFKSVNDHYGHEIGDSVLITLVAKVASILRETDMLGRWGGEEFVVLATQTDLEGAKELAERIRQRVASTPFEEVGRITVSIGIAACRPDDTTSTLFTRADRAMYAAKQAGRNRVHSDEAP